MNTLNASNGSYPPNMGIDNSFYPGTSTGGSPPNLSGNMNDPVVIPDDKPRINIIVEKIRAAFNDRINRNFKYVTLRQVGLSDFDRAFFHEEFEKAFPERKGLTEQLRMFCENQPGSVKIGREAMDRIIKLEKPYPY